MTEFYQIFFMFSISIIIENIDNLLEIRIMKAW